MAIPAFDPGVLQSICDILGDTSRGFTGAEIGRFLRDCSIDDPLPGMTKKHRLFEALKAKQAADRCGNNVAAFIQHTMSPARHHDARDWFEECRSRLNGVLIFAGYSLHEDGKLREVDKAATLSEATARASSLRTHLVLRKVHPDVLRYCREELLVDNYFHSVFEATKSVADKIRTLSGLSADGVALVDEAFSFNATVPYLALSSLRSESERSEQKGFVNLLKGLFGMFRNTTAHEPKIAWEIGEQDALDILSMVSLVHRRLDNAVRARAIYEGRA